MRYIIIVFLFLGTIAIADPTIKKFKDISEDPHFYQVATLVSPRNLFENFPSTYWLMQDEDEDEANSTCYLQLEDFSAAVADGDLWALKMVDASSKIPAGVLQGNLIDLGMYDECLAIRNDTLDIRGQHCMYSANIALQALPLTFSICVPDSCSPENVKKFITSSMNESAVHLDVTISSVFCDPIDTKIWDSEFIICFSIFVIYLSFLIACTVCEIISDRNSKLREKKVISTLTKFSLKKNAAAIFNMEVRKGNLPTLHGIRFISMAWIVLAHEYSLFFTGATVNVRDALQWTTSWNSLYVFLGFFAVDTFFAISGFLMTYLFLKQMPKYETFNVFLYYLHRFLRLTPAVIALIVFTSVFVPKIESGALWHTHSRNTTLEGCRDKWWSILLYLQNFVQKEKPCLGHLWYLAVDMQLFWLSPAILYPLYKKPKIGLVITISLLVVSLVVPTLLVSLNDYRPLSFMVELDQVEMSRMMREFYIMTYTRASAWIVGILMGYVLARSTRKPKRHVIHAGWILTLVGFAICIYGTRYFTAKDYKYDAVLEGFFSAFSRPIWGFAVCWIIYASAHNRAGPISTILSCRVFLPLSRLSYCIYIVHYVVENMQNEAARTSRYFSDYYAWYYFVGDFTISIAVATCFSLLFESPILALEKMLFKEKIVSKADSRKNLKSITSSEESVRK